MHRKFAAASIAFLALAGCQPARRPSGAPPPAPAQTGAEAPSRPAKGALRVGMKAEDVKRLPNLTVEPLTTPMEGVQGKALRITRYGQPIALAELQEGKVVRLRMYSPAYRAPGGGRPGMSAKDLQKLYGPGTVDAASGTVSATFEKAPGARFCFPKQSRLKSVKSRDWAALAAANPRVLYVVLTGAPAAAAARSAGK
jgi:hypothetical protein